MQILEVTNVDKFSQDWAPETLYSKYSVRVIIKETDDIVTNMNIIHQIRRKLKREAAEDSGYWLFTINPLTGCDELYLLNSMFLINWKFKDYEDFSEKFERIEVHDPDNMSSDVST